MTAGAGAGAGVSGAVAGAGALVSKITEPVALAGAGAAGASTVTGCLSAVLFWHPVTASRASSDRRVVFFMDFVFACFVF
jgi:hypothetical protein